MQYAVWQPVSSRKDSIITKKDGGAGKTYDFWERLAPVQSGSAPQFVVTVRGHPQQATDKQNEQYPKSSPRGGRMMSSTGWFLWQQTAPFKDFDWRNSIS